MNEKRVARELVRLAGELEGGSGRRTAREKDFYDLEKEIPDAFDEAYDLVNEMAARMQMAIGEVPGAEKAARDYGELMDDVGDVISKWESLPRVDSFD